MERIVEQTLLYDFYGELLTAHQKQEYEYYLNDYSMSEIADEIGTSRQAVHDLIKRCNKILAEYEDKLKLVEKFELAKDKLNEIHRLAKESEDKNPVIKQIENLSSEIIEDF